MNFVYDTEYTSKCKETFVFVNFVTAGKKVTCEPNKVSQLTEANRDVKEVCCSSLSISRYSYRFT